MSDPQELYDALCSRIAQKLVDVELLESSSSLTQVWLPPSGSPVAVSVSAEEILVRRGSNRIGLGVDDPVDVDELADRVTAAVGGRLVEHYRQGPQGLEYVGFTLRYPTGAVTTDVGEGSVSVVVPAWD